MITKSCRRFYLLSHNNLYSFGSFSEGDLKQAEKYVLQTLRSRSWSQYLIANHIPKTLRPSYCALRLFDLQLIRISDNIRQPSLGLGRLQFWRSTINKIYSSQKPNAQPISICLDHACHNNPLTKGYFQRIINTRAEELSSRNLQSVEHMFRLSQNSNSTLIALTLQLCRIQVEPEHEQLLTYIGRCIGIVSYLRRIPYGLRNYRFLIPLDILSKYNLQPKSIWDRVHGKPSEQFFDAVLQIASYAKKSFEEGTAIYEKLKKQNKIHPEAFRAFLKALDAELYLNDLEKYNFNVFEKGLNQFNPFKFPTSLHSTVKKKQFYNKIKIS